MTKTGKDEPLQALEEEVLKKRAEMSELLEKIQDIPSQVTEQLGKISDFGELKNIGDAVVEMEKNVAEKREYIQSKLRDIQDEMEAFKKLGEKAATEDVTQEMKNLVKRVKEKKESLEKAIEEVQELRLHYSKMFLGK
ncbi:autophagy-related protein 17 [Acidobacteria bacterium AH-259-G07]|nr:autophagy-related protein 17 [Acidobacteria bacterium AH-259-G07]